jgi:hypothetical protein
MSSTLRVSRAITSLSDFSLGKLVGILRNLKVYVDDRHVGSVAWMGTSDFVVTPGTHVIRVKMDWCGSRELSVSFVNSEAVTLECHVPRYEFWRMFTYPNDFFSLHRKHVAVHGDSYDSDYVQTP